MNTVNLVGKIIRKQETGKVTYITIACRASKETEFISITSFQTEFISKYFPIGKWIGIRGHIHINKVKEEYKTEIISDDLFFIGDKTETDVADKGRENKEFKDVEFEDEEYEFYQMWSDC